LLLFASGCRYRRKPRIPRPARNRRSARRKRRCGPSPWRWISVHPTDDPRRSRVRLSCYADSTKREGRLLPSHNPLVRRDGFAHAPSSVLVRAATPDTAARRHLDRIEYPFPVRRATPSGRLFSTNLLPAALTPPAGRSWPRGPGNRAGHRRHRARRLGQTFGRVRRSSRRLRFASRARRPKPCANHHSGNP
jgi:hypothetical protein